MKSYPSINTQINNTQKFYIFNKPDGSNIRAEWNKKEGFTRFGSRRKLITRDTLILGESIDLFLEKYNEDLSKILFDKGYQKATIFGEFFGENSFAGEHKEDEEKDIKIFDISPYKKGILSPEEYLKLTENIDTVELLDHRILTEDVIEQIKLGLYPNMSFEGVVCKAMTSRGLKMFKIKNIHWLNKLKEKCGDDIKLFEKLK